MPAANLVGGVDWRIELYLCCHAHVAEEALVCRPEAAPHHVALLGRILPFRYGLLAYTVVDASIPQSPLDNFSSRDGLV